MAIRKSMMSSPANSIIWGISINPKVIRAVMPRKAKARRKGQKRRVPHNKPPKIVMEAVCCGVRPKKAAPKAIAATSRT